MKKLLLTGLLILAFAHGRADQPTILNRSEFAPVEDTFSITLPPDWTAKKYQVEPAVTLYGLTYAKDKEPTLLLFSYMTVLEEKVLISAFQKSFDNKLKKAGKTDVTVTVTSATIHLEGLEKAWLSTYSATEKNSTVWRHIYYLGGKHSYLVMEFDAKSQPLPAMTAVVNSFRERPEAIAQLKKDVEAAKHRPPLGMAMAIWFGFTAIAYGCLRKLSSSPERLA